MKLHKMRWLWLIVLLIATLPCNSEPLATAGVSLDTPQVWFAWKKQSPDGKGRLGSPLAMELTRQSILLAARDELGLRTADHSLGEALNQPGMTPLKLDLEIVWSEGSHLTLRHGQDTIIDSTVQIPWRNNQDFIAAVIAHEQFSRAEGLKSLKDAGLEGEPNLWFDEAQVPDDVVQLADEISLITQFRAVRALHKLAREEGESPELLWLLSRSYANLAQECRWFIRCEYAVFQARSLLYAQRLRAKMPDHPLGSLAMAYSLTLAGYPEWAVEDCNKFEGAIAGLPEEESKDLKPWLALLRACHAYDLAALDAMMKAGGPTAPVAALWVVMTNEFSYMEGRVFRTIERARQVSPNSMRLVYSGYDAMGVSSGHRLTREAPALFAAITTNQLHQIKQAPGEVLNLIKRLDREEPSLDQLSELGWGLQDLTATGNDTDEMSFGVLGTLFGEANALHILYRASFMRQKWGVDTTDYLDQTHQALDRHPYKPLIMTFLFEEGQVSEEMRHYTSQFTPQYLNLLSLSAFTRQMPMEMTFADGSSVDPWWRAITKSDAQASCERLCLMRWYSDKEQPREARAMAGVDLNHPRRIAKLVTYDSSLNEQQLLELAEKNRQHLFISDAMANRFEMFGNLELAHDFAERSFRDSPEFNTVVNLARIELAMGHEDRWLARMKSGLELQDFGLDHANINQIIARTLMNQDRYEDALPYAEACADSGAGWAMRTYMICLTGLEQYKKAERVALQIQERYGGSSWFDWACWSQQGDQDRVHEILKQINKRDNSGQETTFSICEINDLIKLCRFEDAFKNLEARMADPDKEMTSRHLLMGVCLAQHLKNNKRRDDYLQLLVDYPPEDGKRLRFSLLGDIFKQALADGKLDLDKAEEWAKQYDEDEKQNWTEYGPWFMASMGDERGKELLFDQSRTEAMGPNVAAKWRALARAFGAKESDIRPTRMGLSHAWGPIKQDPAP